MDPSAASAPALLSLQVGWKTTREYYTFMWVALPSDTGTDVAKQQEVQFKGEKACSEGVETSARLGNSLSPGSLGQRKRFGKSSYSEIHSVCRQLTTCPRMMSITSSAMWTKMAWSGEQASLSSSVQKVRTTSWLSPPRSGVVCLKPFLLLGWGCGSVRYLRTETSTARRP